MAASITNPGTVSSYGTYPSASESFLQSLIGTPWSAWSIGQAQALLETLKRLPNGGVPSATVASLLGVAQNSNGPASVSDPQVVQTIYSPALTASVLSSIYSTPPEQTTVSQVGQLLDACNRVAGGSNPNALFGAVIK
jgi:hypothetical protein